MVNTSDIVQQFLQNGNITLRQYVIYTGTAGVKAFRKLTFNIIHATKRREVLKKNRKNRWSTKTREKYRILAEDKWKEEQSILIQNDKV